MDDELTDLDIYFGAGKHVSLTTRHGQQISGTIMAFDLASSMMVVQCELRKIVCVNLSNIESVKTDDQVPGYDIEFKSEPHFFSVFLRVQTNGSGLSVPKLKERLEEAVESKKSLAQDTANNSPNGQKLIVCLNRTLKCKWSNQNIVVVDSKVEISAPYRPLDVKLLPGGNEKGREHVKKIISRFYETAEQ